MVILDSDQCSSLRLALELWDVVSLSVDPDMVASLRESWVSPMLPLGHSWGHGQEMLIFAKLTGFEGHSDTVEMILRRLQMFTVPHPFTTLERCLDNLGQSWTSLSILSECPRWTPKEAHLGSTGLSLCWNPVGIKSGVHVPQDLKQIGRKSSSLSVRS